MVLLQSFYRRHQVYLQDKDYIEEVEEKESKLNGLNNEWSKNISSINFKNKVNAIVLHPNSFTDLQAEVDETNNQILEWEAEHARTIGPYRAKKARERRRREAAAAARRAAMAASMRSSSSSGSSSSWGGGGGGFSGGGASGGW